MLRHHHNADSGSLPANANVRNTPGTLRRPRNVPPKSKEVARIVFHRPKHYGLWQHESKQIAICSVFSTNHADPFYALRAYCSIWLRGLPLSSSRATSTSRSHERNHFAQCAPNVAQFHVLAAMDAVEHLRNEFHQLFREVAAQLRREYFVIVNRRRLRQADFLGGKSLLPRSTPSRFRVKTSR